MKKRLSIIALICAVLLTMTGCSAGFFDHMNFGMTREDVKSAQSELGEPSTILDNESLLYQKVTFLNASGDLILGFGDADVLQRIMFYAYSGYNTDDVYAQFLTQLQKEYPGAADAAATEWTVTNTDVSVAVQYQSGVYLIVTFENIPAE